MVNINRVAGLASMFSEPARAAILQALLDGRALTAGELAGVAGIAPQTASGHLGKLTEAGLVQVTKQGRHRYFRLAGASTAHLFESLLQVAAETAPVGDGRVRTGPRDQAMRLARSCYNHLAGKLGVAIADAMTARGFVELSDDSGVVTGKGQEFLDEIGLTCQAGQNPRAKRAAVMTCRPCLDWSERRSHLAGALGAALCQHCLTSGWLRRRAGTRALEITPAGQLAFHQLFRFRIEVMPVD